MLTVKSLVRDHTAVLPDSFAFCRTPECEVVCYGKTGVFRKPDLKVRVGIKEVEDPVLLCYCFGYSRADVRRDIEANGSTRILENIKAEVRAGFCACEVKNPSGDCCLGDVTRAIKEAKSLTEVAG